MSVSPMKGYSIGLDLFESEVCNLDKRPPKECTLDVANSQINVRNVNTSQTVTRISE